MIQKTVILKKKKKEKKNGVSYSGALLSQLQPGNQCARTVHYRGNTRSTPIKIFDSSEKSFKALLTSYAKCTVSIKPTLLHTKPICGH